MAAGAGTQFEIFGHGALGGLGVWGESLPAVRDCGVYVQFDRDLGTREVLGVGDGLVAVLGSEKPRPDLVIWRLRDTRATVNSGSRSDHRRPRISPLRIPVETAMATGASNRVDADAARIHGPATTPWLLARVAEITDGASIRANTALIVNNGAVVKRKTGETELRHLLSRDAARHAFLPAFFFLTAPRATRFCNFS